MTKLFFSLINLFQRLRATGFHLYECVADNVDHMKFMKGWYFCLISSREINFDLPTYKSTQATNSNSSFHVKWFNLAK